ncbi:MAG: hypothetical protein RBT61_13375 [Candidatus Kapabacteria bacterium]|jgi:hypothetical protein|nr:hypothetical protein [Candidatus Kapabacteria bacterium]
MNLFKIFHRLYQELFHWALDSDTDRDLTKAFNDLENFHARALPESEKKIESLYAKIFKSNLFIFLSPVVYIFLKYLATKFTHPEYINRMIEKEMEE